MFKEDLIKGFSVEKILEKYPPIIDDEYCIYLLESAIKEIISDEVGEKSRVFTAQQLIDLDCNFDQCKFPKEEEEILPPAELLKQYFEKRAALDHEIDKTLSEIQKILGMDIKSCN